MGFILGIDIRCLSPVELWVRHLIKNDLKCSLPAWLPFCFFFRALRSHLNLLLPLWHFGNSFSLLVFIISGWFLCFFLIIFCMLFITLLQRFKISIIHKYKHWHNHSSTPRPTQLWSWNCIRNCILWWCACSLVVAQWCWVVILETQTEKVPIHPYPYPYLENMQLLSAAFKNLLTPDFQSRTERTITTQSSRAARESLLRSGWFSHSSPAEPAIAAGSRSQFEITLKLHSRITFYLRWYETRCCYL